MNFNAVTSMAELPLAMVLTIMLGQHPSEQDSYHYTSTIKSRMWPGGLRCCDGKDCKPYHGPPPVRVVRRNRGGELLPGYLFADTWFFEDERRIDPRTLGEEIRGIPVLCINSFGDPMCWHWPTEG